MAEPCDYVNPDPARKRWWEDEENNEDGEEGENARGDDEENEYQNALSQPPPAGDETTEGATLLALLATFRTPWSAILAPIDPAIEGLASPCADIQGEDDRFGQGLGPTGSLDGACLKPHGYTVSCTDVIEASEDEDKDGVDVLPKECRLEVRVPKGVSEHAVFSVIDPSVGMHCCSGRWYTLGRRGRNGDGDTLKCYREYTFSIQFEHPWEVDFRGEWNGNGDVSIKPRITLFKHNIKEEDGDELDGAAFANLFERFVRGRHLPAKCARHQLGTATIHGLEELGGIQAVPMRDFFFAWIVERGVTNTAKAPEIEILAAVLADWLYPTCHVGEEV